MFWTENQWKHIIPIKMLCNRWKYFWKKIFCIYLLLQIHFEFSLKAQNYASCLLFIYLFYILSFFWEQKAGHLAFSSPVYCLIVAGKLGWKKMTAPKSHSEHQNQGSVCLLVTSPRLIQDYGYLSTTIKLVWTGI